MSQIIYLFLRFVAGPAFADKKFPAGKLLKHFFIQKILRKNANVPWPAHPTSVFKSPEKMSRGSRCPGLAPFCYIDARNGIIIGENTWIGPRVSLISMNHDTGDYTKYIQDNVITGNTLGMGMKECNVYNCETTTCPIGDPNPGTTCINDISGNTGGNCC